MPAASKSTTMRAQYVAWPYPAMPLLASLPSTHPYELNAEWLFDRCGRGPAPARPRIWLAGCGTFQPYAFAVANPHADIVATDLSEASLAIARRRCAVHRQRHVRFAPIDLDDPSTWPDGEFDLIECYGVLMNLADPLAALRGLAAKLTHNGVLRLMVYPHWSRSRVFQLQRVARLLGLSAAERHHPAALRTFVERLPKQHPLRFAFTTYADSKNDAGVVDGFLHAGDRGFTAFQLGASLRDAGLRPGYWFHRPWGQPDLMAERLGFGDRTQSFVLDQLDLWHELRSNFVVCAVRSDAPPAVAQPLRTHPTFCGDGHGLRHRLRLLRLQCVGGRLPSRTGDDAVRLRARDARALCHGDAPRHLRGSGLLLGGADHTPRLPAHEDFAAEAQFVAHAASLRVGRRAPNPLYAHLFAAFEQSQRHPELGAPDLDTMLGRWLPWADPLEQRPITFGLTPYATALRFRVNVFEHLQREAMPTANGYDAVRLRHDAGALAEVRALIAAAPEIDKTQFTAAELRELHVLLCSHLELFLTLQ